MYFDLNGPIDNKSPLVYVWSQNDVMARKGFHQHFPFVRGIYRSPGSPERPVMRRFIIFFAGKITEKPVELGAACENPRTWKNRLYIETVSQFTTIWNTVASLCCVYPLPQITSFSDAEPSPRSHLSPSERSAFQRSMGTEKDKKRYVDEIITNWPVWAFVLHIDTLDCIYWKD